MLLGSSGVGKSTLVNAVVPDAMREVGIVNAVTGNYLIQVSASNLLTKEQDFALVVTGDLTTGLLRV